MDYSICRWFKWLVLPTVQKEKRKKSKTKEHTPKMGCSTSRSLLLVKPSQKEMLTEMNGILY